MGQTYPPVYPTDLRASDDQGSCPSHHRDKAIENSLRELAELQAHATRLAAAIQSLDAPLDQGVDEAFVRGILKARLSRSRYFPAYFFSDPAWDMLLALYAAELGQQRVSVSTIGTAANVPPTTAIRWINHLEREGLVERKPDPLDGRRFRLSLSEKATRALEQYFADTPRFASSG